MGIFDNFTDDLIDYGPMISTGIGAINPIAGVVAGGVFGKLQADRLRKEAQEQRDKENKAKATIIGTSWVPKSVSPDVVSVTPWQGEKAAKAAGAAAGFSDVMDTLQKAKQQEALRNILSGKAGSGSGSSSTAGKATALMGPPTVGQEQYANSIFRHFLDYNTYRNLLGSKFSEG